MRILLLLLLCLGLVPGVAAQPDDAVPLYGNLGPHTRTVTTASPMAQAYFNQGFQLAFAFGMTEAARAFQEAQTHDPDCAMCYWGEAWARGPYINEPMDSTAGVEAYAAIQQAMALRDRATPIERALIEAMAARYAPVPTADNRAALDAAYAEALRGVVRRFPNDLDAATHLGEAIMVLTPWDHWQPDGTPKPGTDEALAVLESVLGRDIQHPGACHLYIHLVEASAHPGRAEACANFLGDAIPGASHIRHMPSHIFMNIGRYASSVKANQTAWHIDQQAAHGGPPGIYPTHNLHMLIFAASMDGQGAVAVQAAHDLARLAPGMAFYIPLTLVRFGRWDDLLDLTTPPEDRFHRGLWHASRGLAHLRRGHPAAAFADSVWAVWAATPEDAGFGFFDHSQRNALKMAHGLLTAEMAAAEGDLTAAIAALEAVIPLEDAFVYDEPEPWMLPLRQVLGALLLDARRPTDAERVYREELADHPENGWSLFGLAQSLDAQGRTDEAAAVWDRFHTAFARADVWLRTSRL